MLSSLRAAAPRSRLVRENQYHEAYKIHYTCIASSHRDPRALRTCYDLRRVSGGGGGNSPKKKKKKDEKEKRSEKKK